MEDIRDFCQQVRAKPVLGSNVYPSGKPLTSKALKWPKGPKFNSYTLLSASRAKIM